MINPSEINLSELPSVALEARSQLPEAKTFASLFTGFGLADIGAMQAGLEPIWGVEIDPAIAEVAQSNLSHDIRVKSVLDCNPYIFEKPDVLWASPSCTNFSIAKTNGKETELDRQLATKIVDFLKVLKPQTFILENVEAYRRSASLEFIEGALYGLGYWIDRQVLNSADFGVPQTRKRMILRAVLGGMPQPLPAPTKWVGWYGTIADLIPSLPESQFADWQLKRLPDEFVNSHIDQNCKGFFANRNTSEHESIRTDNQPAPAITCNATVSSRAFIVDGTANDRGQTLTRRDECEPVFTIRASASKQASRAWLDQGRVVSMTSRALARFQNLPDWYELPDKNTLACKGIGNGVPCKLAEAIVRSGCGR